MTEQEWLSATEEERNAEYSRCQNPYYVYTNYYRSSDGSSPPKVTKERFEEVMSQIYYLSELRFKRLRRY